MLGHNRYNWQLSRSINRPVLCCYLEYLGEHVSDGIDDLVVVVLESHLHVEADKLCQVAVGVGVLRSENSAYREHLAKVGGDRHLLVQLRGLSQVRRTCSTTNKMPSKT